MRMSLVMDEMDAFTMSNVPVCTVTSYTNSALTTIQPMGKSPYRNPYAAAAAASETGMP